MSPLPLLLHEERHEASDGITWALAVYEHPPIRGVPYLSVHATVSVPDSRSGACGGTFQVLSDGRDRYSDGTLSELADKARMHAGAIVRALEAAVALGRREAEDARAQCPECGGCGEVRHPMWGSRSCPEPSVQCTACGGSGVRGPA